MHLSSGEDWEPLSAPGPDRYVQAAVGFGEDVPLQREESPGRGSPNEDVAGAQFPAWREGFSTPDPSDSLRWLSGMEFSSFV